MAKLQGLDLSRLVGDAVAGFEVGRAIEQRREDRRRRVDERQTAIDYQIQLRDAVTPEERMAIYEQAATDERLNDNLRGNYLKLYEARSRSTGKKDPSGLLKGLFTSPSTEAETQAPVETSTPVIEEPVQAPVDTPVTATERLRAGQVTTAPVSTPTANVQGQERIERSLREPDPARQAEVRQELGQRFSSRDATGGRLGSFIEGLKGRDASQVNLAAERGLQEQLRAEEARRLQGRTGIDNEAERKLQERLVLEEIRRARGSTSTPETESTPAPAPAPTPAPAPETTPAPVPQTQEQVTRPVTSSELNLDELNLDEHREGLVRAAYDAAAESPLAKLFPDYPQIFIGKIYQESRFKENAIGPKTKFGRAKGLAQFIDGTAEEVGLADPFNPIEAIYASVKYDEILADRLERKGLPVTPENILAAYNAGLSNVEKYNGIPPFTETENYVNLILNEHKNKVL